MKTILDTEPVETTAITVREPQQESLAPTQEDRKALTPQQTRVIEVSQALEPAYQKASTLELTDEEIEKLIAPFPDEIVEIRPHDGLIYIPHIHISKRLNEIFKPGKWSLICRRHWLEGGTMYGEYVLVVRGCFVGESVGGHPYQPNNPKVNYSDTLESTAAEALRRICGKRLSCGSQVWEPEYARRWQMRYGVQIRGKGWEKRMDGAGATAPARSMPEQHKAVMEAEGKFDANELYEKKRAFLQYATKHHFEAWVACASRGVIPTVGRLEDIAETKVPAMNEFGEWLANEPLDLQSWQVAYDKVYAPDDLPGAETTPKTQAAKPEDYAPNIEQPAWKSIEIHFGQNKGVKLGDLPRAKLYGWAMNWEPQPFKGEIKPEDKRLRDALDQAKAYLAKK